MIKFRILHLDLQEKSLEVPAETEIAGSIGFPVVPRQFDRGDPVPVHRIEIRFIRQTAYQERIERLRIAERGSVGALEFQIELLGNDPAVGEFFRQRQQHGTGAGTGNFDFFAVQRSFEWR